MMRQSSLLRWIGKAVVLAAACAASFGDQSAVAQGLRYQDADELTVDPALGRPNVAPVEAFKSDLPAVDNDALWSYRDFGVGQPALPTIYQSGISEDSPVITQTLTGLTPNNSYDLYAVYWTDEDENWTINTGLNAGSLNFYSWTGEGGNQPTPGSTQGIAASTAVWAVPPPTTKEGTIFTERPADPLVMILGYAGTASANGSGQLDVLVDDNPNAGGGRRTWFDGVAYVDAGTQIATTASLDRTTGEVTLNNPTSQNLEIKSYRIESGATGALDASSWSTIASGNPAWTVLEPVDPANTPHTNLLSEQSDGSTVTLASGGGSLSFGNVWHKSPFDHVLVYLTLADDSLAVLAAHHDGPAIASGDLDGDGDLDLDDFQTLLNGLHTTPGLTRVENYRLGEMTGDGAINFNDWAAFRTAYNAANREGAFAALVAQVPEPGTLALLAIGGTLALVRRRRRLVAAGCAFMLCALIASTSGAEILLSVDVNSRVLEVDPPIPAGTDTVAGFSPYTIDPATTGAQGMSTQTVNGYSISLTAVDASGTPTGMFDDRDRGTPTTTPTLNQLYDDFIFANVGTTGEGGGWDMAINSGGALTPNTDYAISIYAFDTNSTGLRTADWLDGNNGDIVALSTSFDGVNGPVTDEQYRFDGTFRTDGSGNLLLRGRETAAASHGVFLNGFVISDELPPPPAELTLRVNTETGGVSIVNEQTMSFDVSYYEVRSAAGSINLAGWNSLDDAEGGDPVGDGWEEVPASSANLLNEVNLQSMLTLAPGALVSLGSAFSIGGTEDLQLMYAGPEDAGLRTGLVSYVTGPGGVLGDYNNNGTVDAADYVVWRKNLDTSTSLPNDETPGMVTQEDYDVWRAHFGQTAAGAGAALAASTAVPEPGIAALVVVALGISLVGRARRQTGRDGRAM